MYHLTSNYIVPVLLLVLVGLFLAPGFLAGRYLTQRHGLHALYVLPVAALTGCLLGYAAFDPRAIRRGVEKMATVLRRLSHRPQALV